MTRDEKITLLQQIADGKGSIEDLMPPVKYQAFRIVSPKNTDVSISAWDATPPISMSLNDAEYHQWLKDFEATNSRRKEPHTLNVINIVSDEGCKILYHCKALENCLNGCGCKHKEDAMSGNDKR
jgi:hypothetical protein